MKQHREYYHARDKVSVWENQETLFLEIMHYFNNNHKLLIRTVKNKEKLSGIYIIVYNDNEMIFYFGGSLDNKDHYISKAIYFDMLNEAQNLAEKYGFSKLQGLRGTFSNKKRFHFQVTPLFALVHDKNWIIKRDDALTDDIMQNIYKRNFGVDTYGD